MDLRDFRLRRGEVTESLFPDGFETMFDDQCGAWDKGDAARLHYVRGHMHFMCGDVHLALSYFNRALGFAEAADEMVIAVDCSRMVAVMNYTLFREDLAASHDELEKRREVGKEVYELLDTTVLAARVCGDVATYVLALITRASVMTSRLFTRLSEYPLMDDITPITGLIGLLMAEMRVALDSDEGRELQLNEHFMAIVGPEVASIDRALKIDGPSVLRVIEDRIDAMSAENEGSNPSGG